MLSPALDLANNWQFTELWVDPTAVPSYVLILLGDSEGNYCVLDPTQNLKILSLVPATKRRNYGSLKMNTSQLRDGC